MTSTLWVLVAVLAFNGRTTCFTHEFASQATCETAKESIRQKTSEGRYILLTCEKK